MKHAVMYGGGNIGRGFIGALLAASGYRVTFVDVADAVVNGLNEKGEYPLIEERMTVRGTTVIIGHARHRISDLTEGRVPCTRIGLK